MNFPLPEPRGGLYDHRPTLPCDVDTKIRKLRAWHHQQHIMYMNASGMVHFQDMKDANLHQATIHLLAVMALNEIVNGTAEDDLLCYGTIVPK